MSVVIVEQPKQITEWEVYCQECDRIIATKADLMEAHDERWAHEDKLHLKAHVTVQSPEVPT